jgi:gliding motility-associated-like protein
MQGPYNYGCSLFRDTFSFLPSTQIIADVFGCNPDVSNTRLDSIICVEWDIQPTMGFNFISSSFEYFDSIGVLPTLVVEWTQPGTYTIKPIITFNPLFSNCQGMCDCTDDVVFTVEINETIISQLAEIELCPGECIDFCNQTYCQTGTYECHDRDLCLIEIQSVVQRPNIEIDQGLFFICPGDCIEFRDVMYCDANNYEIADSASCDTTYLFQIEEVVFTTNLTQADDLINCTILQAFLEGEWSTNFTGNILSAWISPAGDTLTFGTQYTATDEGSYTFVAWPENMKSCAISITHSVVKDDALPSADLLAPSLDCNNPMDVITIDTQDDIALVQWTGPNGFLSNDINPEVDEAGVYEVLITATNGCQVVVSVEVIGNFDYPDLTLDYNDLTCSENIPTATFESEAPIVSHQWNLPDGTASSNDVLDLNNPGNYSIEITADNGCKTVDNFDILDLSYDPSLHLNEDRIWRCHDTVIDLDLSAFEKANLRYVWTNLQGSVLSNSINLNITSPGVYILTIEDDAVECIGNDTVRVEEDPNPFIDAEISVLPPTCADGADGSVQMVGIEGGTGPFKYRINGAEFSDITAFGFESGMYTLDIEDYFGCVVSKNILVPSTEAYTIDIAPEISVRFGQSETLTFETSLDESEIGVIEWLSGDGEVLGVERELSFIAEQIEFIYLRVEDLDGCEVIAEIKVDLNFDVDIYYPNVFSPNNDGNNDLFVLYNNGFPKTADDLKIFDRSGELVYKSSATEFNETHAGWDGTFNGKPCQPGVYVFLLQYTLMNGKAQTFSGSITLVR